MSARKRDKGTIVIRRDEIVHDNRHNGAWKVAYADFVTAMMAFFLLMWLLNATTQEQKRGLADYFSPTSRISSATSGSGAPFAGRTPNTDGQLASDRGAIDLPRSQPYPDNEQDDTGDMPTEMDPSRVPGTSAAQRASEGGASAGREAQNAGRAAEIARAASQRELRQTLAGREKQEFERAAKQVRETIASDPALADLGKQLQVEMVPEGMRIELLDADRTPMFATGSSALNERARAVLSKVTPIILQMKEPVAIAGHTDAAPYRGGDKTNWDLSADRANATRRLLTDAGLPESRLQSVTGNADREPLIRDDPTAAANRRISITLLRQYPVAKK